MIVRNDLTNPQKAVQGTHASIEMVKQNTLNEHPSVIYIVVKNESKLKKVISEICEIGIQFYIFREPDKNNELTSICTVPLDDIQRSYFKKFQLFY